MVTREFLEQANKMKYNKYEVYLRIKKRVQLIKKILKKIVDLNDIDYDEIMKEVNKKYPYLGKNQHSTIEKMDSDNLYFYTEIAKDFLDNNIDLTIALDELVRELAHEYSYSVDDVFQSVEKNIKVY